MEAFIINREPAVVKAELNVVALIVRKNVSFTFLDSLLETLHGVANDSKAIQDMTCNRTKGTYLLTECLGVYSHETLVEVTALPQSTAEVERTSSKVNGNKNKRAESSCCPDNGRNGKV